MPPNYNNKLNPRIRSSAGSEVTTEPKSVSHRILETVRAVLATVFKYVVLPWLLSQIGVVWYGQIVVFLLLSGFRLAILILNPPQRLTTLIHTISGRRRALKANAPGSPSSLYSNDEVEHQLLLKQREFGRVTLIQRLKLWYYKFIRRSGLVKHFRREWAALMKINSETLEVLGLLPVKAEYIFDRYVLHSPFCVINKLPGVDIGLKPGYEFRGIHLTRHDGFKEYIVLRKEKHSVVPVGHSNVEEPDTIHKLYKVAPALDTKSPNTDIEVVPGKIIKRSTSTFNTDGEVVPGKTTMRSTSHPNTDTEVVPRKTVIKRTTSNPIELLRLAQSKTTTTHSSGISLQSPLTATDLKHPFDEPSVLARRNPQSQSGQLPQRPRSRTHREYQNTKAKTGADSMPKPEAGASKRLTKAEYAETAVIDKARGVDIEILHGTKRNRLRLKLTPKKATLTKQPTVSGNVPAGQNPRDVTSVAPETVSSPLIIRSIGVHEGDYVDLVADAIRQVIPRPGYDDGSLGPILLRLAWHCCATYDKHSNTGGSNGATMRFVPEITDEGNTGLDIARGALEPIKQQFPRITYSDLWTLAGKVAIEYMGGPTIPWQCGRIDCKDGRVVPPNGRLPFGYKDASHIRDTFGRMGFDDKEAVLLMGCHGLGRCHKRFSGWEGKWTEEPTRFSNDFFRVLLEEQWYPGEVPETGKQQYFNHDKSLMMLNTDMELVRDPSFARWVQAYASDQSLFFADFAGAFGKLLELGIARDHRGEVVV